MLGLEGELQVDDVLAVQSCHDVAFVGDHTLLATLEQPFLLHQLQSVEGAIVLEAGQEDPAEASRPDALDDVEVAQLDVLVDLVLPDRLYLEQLALEDADGLASLEIVVLEDISPAGGLPVEEAGGAEVWIVWVRAGVRRMSRSNRTMCGITVSCRLLSSTVAIGMEMRLPL